ncbi:cysteine desulfurase family protein [Corynebacterium belfantii]|uniref:Cysteine desulfurase n=1 Tax=Corynebacterium belfantii TaxID=2014537 RepID=A0ABS0LF43_9CORY|nr:cysteine desulfurase family protein [Corynebacterium belfantii]OLN14705.1 cysteine desulfurase [Corynebacterium diphtheriae] [Corynebacterium diphtheriae subsp. lausannense]MBG9309734.1 cysteine desulfurase [Corynebacterium belfantii]MBG9326329.1 cysteine desulfurase [Corynebacterium belfantii]MBG9330610.1 cysteine desulfurase [Corynebacterium belfantii]MBG9348024.1 cysteine desulfurase [Corynebacterium belfantii]
MQTRYFDHAATTPIRETARTAWLEYAGMANPASQYASGRAARSVLDTAREQIAQLLGCEPIEVIFTASGTESDNIGVHGLWKARQGQAPNRIVTTAIEHPGVLETVKALEADGANVDFLPVDSHGAIVNVEALSTPAAVAAVMWANNETGAIQPIEDVIAAAKEVHTPVHVDAVQLVGHQHINFDELGATTLAASAHKFGGPRGVGLLLARRSPAPQPVMFGGGQERSIRSGTVDVAGAAATAAALAEAVHEIDEENTRLRYLVNKLRDHVVATIDDTVIHTPRHSLPGHLHLSFPGAEGDSLIMLLDSLGLEASTGSACSNGVNRASHVLLAMGVSESTARSAVRFTLGATTTEEDVDTLIAKLPDVVARARFAGMA